MFKRLFLTILLALIPALLIACNGDTNTTINNNNAPLANNSTDGDEEYTYRYDDLPSPDDEGSLAEFRAISSWPKQEISFFFENDTDKLSSDEARNIVRQAFALWAQAAPLTFSEASSANQADILISWAEGNHGDGDPFDGPGDVLAHAEFPNPFVNRQQVILHFDDSENWVNNTQASRRSVDLFTVAVHEIGHTLGLGHSRDPNAIMFASYGGPARQLSPDDIAGVQRIYGVNQPARPTPAAPPPAATAEPSNSTDSDGDGLSDRAERWMSGTDPNNPDTDGDGLSDGIEVKYRMNPLDPDMDKDGISDGAEVQAGTDPFTPNQTDVSPELTAAVSEFLYEAIRYETEAYRSGDPTEAAIIFAGTTYDNLVNYINDLNQQDVVQIATFDYYNSYIYDIRVINDSQIEVDTCEYWDSDFYVRSTGEYLQGSEGSLTPQTITLQELATDDWYVTNVDFYDAPHFCQ
ncbi:MAG TPA: matrixin family metalloprotease [Anaerolineae bacterium]|nr:matrixin family metalloprotease [Anaerolineae bacterium]